MTLLRELWTTCAAAAALPLPVLLATDRPEIAVMYLGLASAWLATEILRFEGLPTLRSEWCGKMLAVCAAVFANVALFVAFGVLAHVQTNFPFPIMAALSATPAIGLVPWLFLRVRNQYAAIVFGAFIVGAAKIAGCLAARLAYGPDFIEAGYTAGDWRTAKLMITVFWILTVAISLSLLWAGYTSMPKPDGTTVAGDRDRSGAK